MKAEREAALTAMRKAAEDIRNLCLTLRRLASYEAADLRINDGRSSSSVLLRSAVADRMKLLARGKLGAASVQFSPNMLHIALFSLADMVSDLMVRSGRYPAPNPPLPSPPQASTKRGSQRDRQAVGGKGGYADVAANGSSRRPLLWCLWCDNHAPKAGLPRVATGFLLVFLLASNVRGSVTFPEEEDVEISSRPLPARVSSSVHQLDAMPLLQDVVAEMLAEHHGGMEETPATIDGLQAARLRQEALLYSNRDIKECADDGMPVSPEGYAKDTKGATKKFKTRNKFGGMVETEEATQLLPQNLKFDSIYFSNSKKVMVAFFHLAESFAEYTADGRRPAIAFVYITKNPKPNVKKSKVTLKSLQLNGFHYHMSTPNPCEINFQPPGSPIIQVPEKSGLVQTAVRHFIRKLHHDIDNPFPSSIIPLDRACPPGTSKPVATAVHKGTTMVVRGTQVDLLVELGHVGVRSSFHEVSVFFSAEDEAEEPVVSISVPPSCSSSYFRCYREMLCTRPMPHGTTLEEAQIEELQMKRPFPRRRSPSNFPEPLQFLDLSQYLQDEPLTNERRHRRRRSPERRRPHHTIDKPLNRPSSPKRTDDRPPRPSAPLPHRRPSPLPPLNKPSRPDKPIRPPPLDRFAVGENSLPSPLRSPVFRDFFKKMEDLDFTRKGGLTGGLGLKFATPQRLKIPNADGYTAARAIGKEHLHEFSKVAERRNKLPESYDPRTHYPDCFPEYAVKDQGLCGSCWAASSTTAMADRQCILDGTTIHNRHAHTFSTQLLMDCLEKEKHPCEGGLPIDGFKLGEQWGMDLSPHYPYSSMCHKTDKDAVVQPMTEKDCGGFGHYPLLVRPCECQKDRFNPVLLTTKPTELSTCRYDKDDTKLPFKVHRHFHLSAANETYFEGGNRKKVSQEDAELHVKLHLKFYGPLVATYTVYQDFDFHRKNGLEVYRYNGTAEKKGRHSVVLMGWGEDEKEGKYWLAKNSWGNRWGNKGYFKIVRGENHCGFEEDIVGAYMELQKTQSPVTPKEPQRHSFPMSQTAEAGEFFLARDIEGGIVSMGMQFKCQPACDPMRGLDPKFVAISQVRTRAFPFKPGGVGSSVVTIPFVIDKEGKESKTQKFEVTFQQTEYTTAQVHYEIEYFWEEFYVDYVTTKIENCKDSGRVEGAVTFFPESCWKSQLLVANRRIKECD
uniref:Peptidase C1A papain C-terminal domain-containing protein n=1 Tax=Chromera velia CCMP2878 TaxID=1169474 RepID=A0A0G4G9L9_9ALVE|eukprot:Cvel_20919.t1-p1 / transcript=Cvel_20919.t1 / gene=Cvel_20919 / organism=Chromera_velia_CCMP2878 / gene_product=Cathepsin B-like cysteine proteinase 1, putative / transcript_product=Cathepsin B-like cysteine proteinase 1, putative / location=Cvel_scaffold1919:25460-33941(-) / protein_length=1180 / sequence_SO=supercontig / SO=protein_coding / is_pseudo=false